MDCISRREFIHSRQLFINDDPVNPPPRCTVTEEGNKVIEWSCDLSSLKNFLETQQSGSSEPLTQQQLTLGYNVSDFSGTISLQRGREVAALIKTALLECSLAEIPYHQVVKEVESWNKQGILKKSQKFDIYVASQSNVILGTGSLHGNGKSLPCLCSHVINTGVGSTILHHLLTKIDCKKHSHAILTATPSGVPFYQKNGFRFSSQGEGPRIFRAMECALSCIAQQAGSSELQTRTPGC